MDYSLKQIEISEKNCHEQCFKINVNDSNGIQDLVQTTKLLNRKRYLETIGREDIVIKSILRKMRAFYISKFNETTRFISIVRYRDKTLFYRESIKKFIISFISESNEGKKM